MKAAGCNSPQGLKSLTLSEATGLGYSQKQSVLIKSWVFLREYCTEPKQIRNNSKISNPGPSWSGYAHLLTIRRETHQTRQPFSRAGNYGKLWMVEIPAAMIFFFAFAGCFASVIVSFYSFFSYLQLMNINKWLKTLYSTLIVLLSFLFCFVFLKQTIPPNVLGAAVNVEIKWILGIIFLLT